MKLKFIFMTAVFTALTCGGLDASLIGSGTLALTNTYPDGHPGHVVAAATAASAPGDVFAGFANCRDIALVTNLPAFLTGNWTGVVAFEEAVQAKLFTDMIAQSGDTLYYALAIWETRAPALTPDNMVSAGLLAGAQTYVTGLAGDYSEFGGVSIFTSDFKRDQSFLFASAGGGDQGTDTPEPVTTALISAGLMAIGWWRRKCHEKG